jgi:DNA-binding response OmpR family regulator
MRVLVVEDERRLADGIRLGLEREGFAIDVAYDGNDGLSLAKQHAYDAVLLDIMLPGRDGYDVCAELRDAAVWTPILVLTAKEGDRAHVDALERGADDFLTKPFSFAVLVAHLRALVRRGAGERPVVLTAGDLRLDPGSHRCWRGETEVALTARQFSLLEYLMRRRGEVVSKQEILANVWTDAFTGDVNIVEVYVGSLRKKIDAAFGRHSIQTVRLVGYRLDPDGG